MLCINTGYFIVFVHSWVLHRLPLQFGTMSVWTLQVLTTELKDPLFQEDVSATTYCVSWPVNNWVKFTHNGQLTNKDGQVKLHVMMYPIQKEPFLTAEGTQPSQGMFLVCVTFHLLQTSISFHSAIICQLVLHSLTQYLESQYGTMSQSS